MTAVRWAAPTALVLITAFWFGAELMFLAVGRGLRWKEQRHG